MLKKILLTTAALAAGIAAFAEARFPKPDFTSGYEYPEIIHGVPNEHLLETLDIILLTAMMSAVVWAAYRKRNRGVIYTTSVISVLYFGFFRSGCVCSVGSIQNVVLALADQSYTLPLYVLLIFLLPIIFTLLFGRVFCAGVCPLGAIQELVNVRNFRMSRAVSSTLSLIPWVYLAFTIMYAATRSQFLVCRLDPFIGIFRLGGDIGMITFGVILLVISTFIGRPFCQFLCPYGAILSVFSRLSWKKIEITDSRCINCSLCHKACPVDAIRSPQTSKVNETRQEGVRRIIILTFIVPLLTLTGALLVGSCSKTLSMAHKDVYLYHLLTEVSYDDDGGVPLEVDTFNAMGGNIDELQEKVEDIRHDYLVYSRLAGAIICLIIGMKLVNLSLKRSRKTYEIESSKCTVCGKCFNYCPQNKLKKQ